MPVIVTKIAVKIAPIVIIRAKNFSNLRRIKPNTKLMARKITPISGRMVITDRETSWFSPHGIE